MKEHDDGTELEQCRNCENGEWFTECCSGANGCDCRGQVLSMGKCNVCSGAGWHKPHADTKANLRTIQGRCFIGSGPTRGYWAGK